VHQRLRQTIISLTAVALLLAALVVSAQDSAPTMPPDLSGAGCAPALESLWTAASNACINGPEGFICNGGSPPTAEPGGPVANALAPAGALVETALVDAIQTLPLAPDQGIAGVAWLRAAAPLRFSALMIGSVSLRDISPPDFPAWQSFTVQTAPELSSCAAAPLNVLIVQSQIDQPTRLVANGISILLDGTLLVRAANDQTLLVGLAGAATVTANGQPQPLQAGQQVVVANVPGDLARTASPPSPAAPFIPAVIRSLPAPLFDRPFVLPQPGIVVTQADINLRSFPSLDAGIITQIPGGVSATVLGRNPAGDWYHVRIGSGLTGWLKADLLRGEIGQIEAAYDATPVIPQRYGPLGTTGTIISPAGVNLRSGPDPGYPAMAALGGGTVVTLLARSPYSAWVKVDAGGVIGWLALVVLDTRAFIDAIPIDYTAPPQPTPTRIPGSFGNAFPDPDSAGN
jgi:uncharacterized protein YraI